VQSYTSPAFQGAENMRYRFRIHSRPIRTVLRWQVIATAVLAAIAGIWAGTHGAVSAVAGGTVSVVSGLVAAVVVARKSSAQSAGGVLIGALMAEGIRIGLIVLLLGLVLATYRDVVMPAFIGSFVLTALFFAMAFFLREYE
jgi:ATP synthase protein I